MKKIYLIFIAILFTSCSQNQNYLLEEGVIDIDYLKNSPKTYWFNENFENYTVEKIDINNFSELYNCLLYTSPSPRDLSTSRMPSSA